MEKKYPRGLGLSIRNKAQKHFIVLEFVLLLAAMVFLLYIIFQTVGSVAARVPTTGQVPMEAIFDEINYLLLIRVSILFGAVFIINVLFGLFFLHHLTGPLVRIRTVLNQIADGDIPDHDVTLRKGDFPIDVADALSRAIHRMRSWRKVE